MQSLVQSYALKRQPIVLDQSQDLGFKVEFIDYQRGQLVSSRVIRSSVFLHFAFHPAVNLAIQKGNLKSKSNNQKQIIKNSATPT